jgi:quercetin dioxygenase-like cupin family protein
VKVMSFSALFLLASFANVQAQEAVPLAHGNVPGEPHHHLKIENEYVRAYYVEVPPHEDTQLHQHDHDYIYVSLGPSDVVNAILNKPEIHLQLKDGETHFTRGGFAHVARNLADTPFRNITIELLKPQNNLRNVCAEVVQGSALGQCQQIVDKHVPYKTSWKQFETSDISLRLVRLSRRSEMFAMVTEVPLLLVALDGAQIQIEKYGKPAQSLASGDLIWLEERSVSVVRNLSEKPSSYLSLRFRD